jgi:catechol 2,3-dioxygenase
MDEFGLCDRTKEENRMPDTQPSVPTGVNHIVLNVKDIEVSHRFYTEVLGYVYIGSVIGPAAEMMTMRFFTIGNKHHDIALVEEPDLRAPDKDRPLEGLSHLAIGYPDRESFLNQIQHLQACGLEFHMRGNHGMTHSAYITDPDGNTIEVLYELSREFWKGDVEAALTYFDPLPLDGPESLEDTTDYKRF